MAHTIIYTDKNDVIVFGCNDYGQLGLGHCTNQSKPILLMNNSLVKQISCGDSHSLIYRSNGELYVFGSNYSGQLGLGNNVCIKYEPILLMNDSSISKISCGMYHSFICKSNGEIYVFGANEHGQLGLGHNDNVNVPVLLKNDSSIIQISCGARHSIIYKSNGELLVFGSNISGQLGLGNNEHQNKPILLMDDPSIYQISCGACHSIIHKSTGELLVFGSNISGQLGLGDKNITSQNKPVLLMNNSLISQISCGDRHSMIYKSNGELLVFGCNYWGQLGLGHKIYQSKPVLLLNDSSIKQINCGKNHSIIYKLNGELLVFGANYNAQLGLGHYTSQNKPVSLLLDNVSSIEVIQNVKELSEWTPRNHIRCLQSFKQKILVFLKCLKRLQANTKLRIPKFVLFEIIKLVYQN